MFLLIKDKPENSITFVSLIVGELLSIVIVFVTLVIIGIIYVIVGTKTDLLRISYINIRSKLKSIIKRGLLVSAILVLVVYIPQFFILLLNIDHPDFNEAFANLIVFGINSFFGLFVVIFLLLCILVTIVTIWRKYHPRVITKDNAIMATTEKTQSTEPPAQPAMAEQVSSPYGQYFYMFVSGISGFVYLMYYVGRAYFEGFFSSIGVPKDLISFQLHDYAYSGAQIDTILITGAFTAVLVGLLMNWFRKHIDLKRPNIKIEVGFVLIYLCLYSVLLIIFAFLQIFRLDLIIEIPVVMSVLMTCLVTLTLLILVLYFDQVILSNIWNSKIKRNIFIVAAIITLLCSPYMGGKAWGAYKGQIAKITDFPAIELYTNKVLTDEINWITVDNVTFKSNQELHLVLKTNDYIFVKTTDKTSPVYVLNTLDVLSTKVLYSEKSGVMK
jgi:hypothetical protein